MAKFFKHLGIGKKPPALPRKDYEQSLYANASTSGVKCTRFEVNQSKPTLIQEYTDPLDFRKEAGIICEDENLYTNPTEEDVYSEPYEVGELTTLDLSERNQVPEQSGVVANGCADDFYDEVSSGFDHHHHQEELLREKLAAGDEHCLLFNPEDPDDDLVVVEYDEPWEWGASSPVVSPVASTRSSGARPPVAIPDGSPLSSSGSCYPTLDYDGGSSGNLLDSESSLSFEFREDNDMPIRHIYETAFDSKVKRETEDIDSLTRSPILRGESSSSTSSPGSAGRETTTRLKLAALNGNGVVPNGGGKNSGSNSHHHHHHHHRRNFNARKNNGEKISRSRTTEGILTAATTDNDGLFPPPELPKPRLPPSSSRNFPFTRLKIESGLSPDRGGSPPQPTNNKSLTTGQVIKIKAVIENAPTSIRSSQSSSSNSSLEDNRNTRPPEVLSFCPSSKSMTALKTAAMTNGNAALNAKSRAALNEQLTSALKNKFKTTPGPLTTNPRLNEATAMVTDNNNLAPATTFLNGFSSRSNVSEAKNDVNCLSSSSIVVPTRNEICPKCCQPIVVGDSTPLKQQFHLNHSSNDFNPVVIEGKSRGGGGVDSTPSRNVLLCKCTAVQSPENDARPLAEYDLPWDVPKRLGPFIVAALNGGPGSSGSSSVAENENEIEKEVVSSAREDRVGGTKEEVVGELVKESNPRRALRLNFPEPKDLKCLDFESNSAPAALNKIGAEIKGTNESCSVVSITKSPSETQITQPDPIFECAKFKLPTGPATRKNLNLNFNTTTNAPAIKNLRQGLGLNFGFSSLSARGESVDASIPLEEQGWYHGSISRIDAENSLRVLKEGSYLVRNSESSKKDYSLSLKSARGFMHMKIVNNEGSYILGQFSKPFSSIPEMIHHYSNNKLPIRGAEHMSLLYPVIDQLL